MWGNPRTAKQKDRLPSFLILNVIEAKIFHHVFLEGHNDHMSEDIIVIDRQHRETCRHYGNLWTQTTKPEFLVAKDEILAALATVPVALLSLLTMYLTKFYRLTIMWCWWNVRTSCPIIMWNWPDIFKIWSDNVRWPTVIWILRAFTPSLQSVFWILERSPVLA